MRLNFQPTTTALLLASTIPNLVLAGGGNSPTKGQKQQQVDRTEALPLFGCSSEQKLKEIESHFPKLKHDVSIVSDDFLPIWVQNGSIWISTEREIAAQILHQEPGEESPGLFSIVLKNYCEPSQENTASGSLLTAALAEQKVESSEAERVIPPFALTGNLIQTPLKAFLQLTFVPTPKTPGSKGILQAEILVENLQTNQWQLLDSFSLQNLKELEK